MVEPHLGRAEHEVFGKVIWVAADWKIQVVWRHIGEKAKPVVGLNDIFGRPWKLNTGCRRF
jgi:hypothetical protein